eukprot:Em0262g1a
MTLNILWIQSWWRTKSYTCRKNEKKGTKHALPAKTNRMETPKSRHHNGRTDLADVGFSWEAGDHENGAALFKKH